MVQHTPAYSWVFHPSKSRVFVRHGHARGGVGRCGSLCRSTMWCEIQTNGEPASASKSSDERNQHLEQPLISAAYDQGSRNSVCSAREWCWALTSSGVPERYGGENSPWLLAPTSPDFGVFSSYTTSPKFAGAGSRLIFEHGDSRHVVCRSWLCRTVDANCMEADRDTSPERHAMRSMADVMRHRRTHYWI